MTNRDPHQVLQAEQIDRQTRHGSPCHGKYFRSAPAQTFVRTMVMPGHSRGQIFYLFGNAIGQIVHERLVASHL